MASIKIGNKTYKVSSGNDYWEESDVLYATGVDGIYASHAIHSLLEEKMTCSDSGTRFVLYDVNKQRVVETNVMRVLVGSQKGIYTEGEQE